MKTHCVFSAEMVDAYSVLRCWMCKEEEGRVGFRDQGVVKQGSGPCHIV